MTIATNRKTNAPSTMKGGLYNVSLQTVFPRPAVYTPLPPVKPQTWPQSRRPSGWLALAIVSGGLVLLALLWTARDPVIDLLNMAKDQQAASAYLRSFGALGPLLLVLAQFLQVLLAVIPGHVFLVAAGYAYGFIPGLLLNYLSIVAASQFAFSLARWAGHPLVSRLVPAKALARWYRLGERQGLTFFTISFVLPVFPTDIMNFVAGLSGISWTRFLAANMLGRLPGAIMLTLIGSHGLQISPVTWAILALIVAALYLLGRFVVTRLDRHTSPAAH